MGICRSLCHSFTFVNMVFVAEVVFFPIKFYKKIYFHGKFVTEFVISFFSLTYLSELFLRNNFRFRVTKKGPYSSLPCIFNVLS